MIFGLFSSVYHTFVQYGRSVAWERLQVGFVDPAGERENALVDLEPIALPLFSGHDLTCHVGTYDSRSAAGLFQMIDIVVYNDHFTRQTEGLVVITCGNIAGVLRRTGSGVLRRVDCRGAVFFKVWKGNSGDCTYYQKQQNKVAKGKPLLLFWRGFYNSAAVWAGATKGATGQAVKT